MHVRIDQSLLAAQYFRLMRRRLRENSGEVTQEGVPLRHEIAACLRDTIAQGPQPGQGRVGVDIGMAVGIVACRGRGQPRPAERHQADSP